MEGRTTATAGLPTLVPPTSSYSHVVMVTVPPPPLTSSSPHRHPFPTSRASRSVPVRALIFACVYSLAPAAATAACHALICQGGRRDDWKKKKRKKIKRKKILEYVRFQTPFVFVFLHDRIKSTTGSSFTQMCLSWQTDLSQSAGGALEFTVGVRE